MKILLLKDVPNVGHKNDVKDVNDGFARNFLLARKLAIVATDEKISELERGKKDKKNKEQIDRKKYQDIADKLSQVDVIIPTKVGEKGKAFGSIGNREIKKALGAQWHMIEESWIDLEESIKTTGTIKIPLKFPHGVQGSLTVTVRPE